MLIANSNRCKQFCLVARAPKPHVHRICKPPGIQFCALQVPMVTNEFHLHARVAVGSAIRYCYSDKRKHCKLNSVAHALTRRPPNETNKALPTNHLAKYLQDRARLQVEAVRSCRTYCFAFAAWSTLKTLPCMAYS